MGRTDDADPFDPERLRASAESPAQATSKKPSRPPRHQPREKFLKGPIPWGWLVRAGRQSNGAMLVALALWHEAGMKNNRTVRFCLSQLEAFDRSIQVARRGLRALEAAGLVTVQLHAGRCLDVTILDATEQ